MGFNWKAISDNLVNISQVLTDFLDTENSKDVEWVYTDDDNNPKTITLPNVAKVLEDIESDLTNKIEIVIGDYLMFSDEEPTNDINPKYKGFLYVKYNSDKPDRSELYVCVDNTENENVWGRLTSGELSVFINSNTTLDVNTKYFVDTTVDNIVLSLPDVADNNDKITIIDARHNADNKPVTVECGDYKINDDSNDLICDVSGFLVGLVYNSDANTWYTYNAAKGE